jgi:hypothetical protein
VVEKQVNDVFVAPQRDAVLASDETKAVVSVTGGDIAAGATAFITTSADALFGASTLGITATASGLTIAPDSCALTVIDPARRGPITAAYGHVAQPFVRGEWERVWCKGGSLEGTTGLLTLAHSGLVESDSRGTYVVEAMANNQAGGIDQFQVQSVTSRILQLVKAL